MKKSLSMLAIAIAVSACTSRGPDGALESWNNYSNKPIRTEGLKENQALAVFYRPAESQKKAINVYVNGDYQASLLDHSFTSIPVCATKQLFTSSVSSATKFGNRTDGARYTLPVNDIAYIRVNADANGKAVLSKVSKETAEQEMQGLKYVSNTLSRVVTHKDCEPVIAAKDLSASALFKFDKSGYNDLLPKAKQEVHEFAAQIKALDANKINRIVISGYTDPQGSAAYNKKLSQRRAESVARLLRETGVNAKIEAIGYGQADLLVPNCAALHPAGQQRIACNQPNRRVEIAVYGKN